MAHKGGNPYYCGPVTDHFDGRRFFNPGGLPPANLTALLRWRLNGRQAKWPPAWPSPYAPARPASRGDGGDLRVIMVGHATLLIQAGGVNMLTDPVWSERASPFSFAGPKRANAPGIAFDDLPPIHAVLLTHNHYDHLDIATLKRLHADHDPLVMTPLGNDSVVRPVIPSMRFATGDWHQAVEAPGGLRVHFEPCHHWSARGFGDRRMALWSAFVIETPAGKVYHVGDTGFHDGINYRAAARKHGRFRLAILPIGAYEPRWFMERHHQNPDEAVRGFLLSGADHAVGHHWGTFQLTDEAIDEPAKALDAALTKHGVPPERFRALRPGERWDSRLAG